MPHPCAVFVKSLFPETDMYSSMFRSSLPKPKPPLPTTPRDIDSGPLQGAKSHAQELLMELLHGEIRGHLHFSTTVDRARAARRRGNGCRPRNPPPDRDGEAARTEGSVKNGAESSRMRRDIGCKRHVMLTGRQVGK